MNDASFEMETLLLRKFPDIIQGSMWNARCLHIARRCTGNARCCVRLLYVPTGLSLNIRFLLPNLDAEH